MFQNLKLSSFERQRGARTYKTSPAEHGAALPNQNVNISTEQTRACSQTVETIKIQVASRWFGSGFVAK